MCGEVCQITGWLGWLAFAAMLVGALVVTQWNEWRLKRRSREIDSAREAQVQRFRRRQLTAETPRKIEIGTLREVVEILDEPEPGPFARPGLIKHENGENAQIDYETLQLLIKRARLSRPTVGRVGRFAA